MILFVDTDIPGARAHHNRKSAPKRLKTLLAGLEGRRDLVQVVLSSPWTTRFSPEQLRSEFSCAGSCHIEGALWDDVPPAALARYDHIIYWLTRRHVWRLPSWLAVQADEDGWPSDHKDALVLVNPGLESAESTRVLRTELERYYWWDLWWGRGPPPDATLLRRAHALMVAWSVARSRWPVVLGTTASEDELRLEPLLTVHAGAQHRVRAGEWFPHWVHLPSAGLQMHRPIELIETQGLDGIRLVLEHVWAPPAAAALAS